VGYVRAKKVLGNTSRQLTREHYHLGELV
jgi:hypothetical protein